MESVYKNILKELRVIGKQAHVVHSKSDLARQKARLEYEKLQHIRANKSIDHITKQIQNLKASSQPSTKFEEKFKSLYQQKSQEPTKMPWVQQEQFQNIYKYLSSQRVYQELLERYNPGITMDTQENISRSAARVGLKAPE